MQNSRGSCESGRPAFGPENFVSIQPAAASPRHVHTAFRRRDESEVPTDSRGRDSTEAENKDENQANNGESWLHR